jgi:hypothetical protein
MDRISRISARGVGVLLTAGALAGRGQEGGEMKTEPAKVAESVCIEGVDRYRVCEPLFEFVRVVLAQHGESYSTAYLQGISGAAFRIAGICPCAPTCSAAMQTEALVELLGYKARRLNLHDKGAVKVQDLADAMQANGSAAGGGRAGDACTARTPHRASRDHRGGQGRDSRRPVGDRLACLHECRIRRRRGL